MKIADISAWNGAIDWDKARGELEMVILRASCGMKADTRYAANAATCGLPYGAYHYVKANTAADARAEAEFFATCARKGTPLFYILDVEYEAQNECTTEPVCLGFLERLRELGCGRIGLYVGQPHINWIGSARALCDIMWVPRWGRDDGTLDERYAPAQTCDLWQYTSNGVVTGIKGRVDLNAYRNGRTLGWFTGAQRDEMKGGEHGMPTNLELAAYCEKVHAARWAYWYGTCGYQCTQSLFNSKRQQYPQHYGSDRMSGYMADIAAGKMCADCVGLIKSFFWKGGDINGKNVYQSNNCPDRSADGLFALCDEKGAIGSITDIPGLVVHKPGHIGVYVGDGYTIEMKGFAYDCVRSKVTDGPWTEWGRLPDTMLEYVGAGTARTLGSRTIRKGVNGADVRELQEGLMSLGYTLPRYGADGDCGGETVAAITAFQTDNGLEADGAAGRKTIEALKKKLDADAENTHGGGASDSAAAAQTEPAATYHFTLRGVPPEEVEAALRRLWPDCEVTRE